MTVRRAIYLMCDVCCAITDVDTMATAAELRRLECWDRRDGKDICRRCQHEQRMSARPSTPQPTEER